MNSQVQITICNWLNKLPGIFLAAIPTFILIGFGLYVRDMLSKVKIKEDEIFKLQDRIDNMEQTILPRIRNSLVTQPQLDKMVEKECKPLKARLNKLKMERQFLLDRIPILGLIKK
jgi:hypothetical protein